MVKILGICGSPRKKSAYTALKAALEAAEATGDVEVELVELRGRKLNFCIHCNQCTKQGVTYCPVYKDDDMTELYEKFYNADGYIIATPVYEMNITAQLATFFNRFRPTWTILKDDPDFFARKVGGGIAVGGTRNGGQEQAINGILGFYHTQGITVCNGGVCVYAGASLWNPGDGSGTMDDPEGMEKAQGIGRKVAMLTKLLAPKKEEKE